MEYVVRFAYQKYLDREADNEGLTQWVNALNNGASVGSVLNAFRTSEERRNLVGLLYTNLLERVGSADEVQGWAGSDMSMSSIKGAFMASPEYRGRIKTITVEVPGPVIDNTNKEITETKGMVKQLFDWFKQLFRVG